MNQQKIDFAVGGQALIEGVMMRSPNYIAMAVRKPDGSIKVKDYPYKTFIQRHKWANIALVRGVINMIEMMGIGMKAIDFSANEFVEEEGDKDKEPSKFWSTLFFVFNMVFAFIFAIMLFKFLPLWITELINEISPAVQDNFILYNSIDGILKLAIFTLYIVVIMISKTIRRVFEYHGAEHKAVFNYEADIALTPENSAKQSRFHPRCGTSFIIFVFVISIIVYTFIPRHPDFWLHLGRRLLVLPVIAGISYEVLKASAKNINTWWVKILTIPGMLFQRLTTSEPDEEQLEVAIAALKRTLELENEGKN